MTINQIKMKPERFIYVSTGAKAGTFFWLKSGSAFF
jgi:hypothetical protein